MHIRRLRYREVMLVFGLLHALAAPAISETLPEYTELVAEKFSVDLEPGRSMSIFALCRFINRKIQIWGPDGTIWTALTRPEDFKVASERMSFEQELVQKDPRKPPHNELCLYVLTVEKGKPFASQTLVTDRFQPSGGGTGKIIAQLFPKLTPSDPYADISVLAAPDEVGQKLFSFGQDLSGLPDGIKVTELRVDKSANSWWYYINMTGLSTEVTKRWYGLQTDEGNLFETKYPNLGRVVSETHPDEKSLNACAKPEDNPGRTFHLYVCRTWKITFPHVRLRPNGWRGD